MEIVLSKESPIPLHLQLLNQLRRLVLSGDWPPGTHVPSEHTLQVTLGVSRGTIRQAIRQAEAEGLVETVPGKGTFVAVRPAQQGPSRLIGFVIPFFCSTFDSQLLQGTEQAAKAQGYRVIFCNSERKVQEENRQLASLLQERMAGVVVWPVMGNADDRLLVTLSAQGVPVALVDRTVPGLEADLALCDNFGGGYAATRHLIELGHRRIVFLARDHLHLLPIAERLRGYRQAMTDAGLDPLEPMVVRIPHEISTLDALRAYADGTGEDIAEIARHLTRSPQITALVGMNDLLALAALKAASALGVRVPQQLSVTGFDDLEVVSHLPVPLTTVAQDPLALGREAATLLLRRVEDGPGLPRRVVLPTQLIRRASTAVPPG